MAISFGYVFLGAYRPRDYSVIALVKTTLVIVSLIAATDAWYSRRMGLTIEARGLTLHYAAHRERVQWVEVQGFEWKRWNTPRTEWIWITRAGGGGPIRIPTIQRAPAGRSGPYYRRFASTNLRLRGGVEVDAMTTLQRAHATMQRELAHSSAADQPCSKHC
jgi:hypothetical protein